MPRNKAIIGVMLFFFVIAVIYNLRFFTKGRGAKGKQQSQNSQNIGQTSTSVGQTSTSVKVGDIYILTEKYEGLLEHEIKGSTRDPFIELKGNEKESPPSKNVRVIQPFDSIRLMPRIDRNLQPQQVEVVHKEENVATRSQPLEKKEESSEKLQPLEIKGIIVSHSRKSVIINDRVFSEGDYIGEERLTEIKPDSVVLEREGRKRELRLKQSSSPVKVQRSR